ncbi:cation transporter [Legionella israelensis]|uniref:Cation transporter n=1 Tax=Legionella israelensis TaxID=454 RepID=A0AAX1EET6_9GAMM|nr:cation diffusion facilitator family transporter [Legionella israelensis]QBR83594.1 cation transporter [Legionella israelensis]
MPQINRYQQVKKITLISVIVNFLLGLSKLVGGFLFNSHALVADGIHSFSDLLTDGMVLFASKYGSLDADKNHPYGHQRIETAATVFLAILLILAGAGISWDAMDYILNANFDQPDWLSLPVIIGSILANELLFHYTHFIGRRIQSDLLIANAWHHRSDAASSLIVLAGVIGSLAGFFYFDGIAAIIVGLFIIKMGWNYGWSSIKELVDTAVDPDTLVQIKHIINEVNGVDKIHQLRSRLMGGDIFIDVHILVAPRISVSEGHYIAQHVHQNLMNYIPRVKDVTVHVDPEDDEIVCPSMHLPNRSELKKQFLTELSDVYPELIFWTLHYQDGKIIIDLVFSNKFTQWQDLDKHLQKILKSYPYIDHFRLLSQQQVLSSNDFTISL